ncbi:hypothetical protein ACROYT_G028281 [Oculina patagonica]
MQSSYLNESFSTFKLGRQTTKVLCYGVSDEVATFYQANTSCISEGAGLVSIELDFIDTILPDREKVFVGMTDIAEEGRWVWMDGSVPTLDPLWHGNHPDGGLMENCGEYQQDHGFHDIKCDFIMFANTLCKSCE